MKMFFTLSECSAHGPLRGTQYADPKMVPLTPSPLRSFPDCVENVALATPRADSRLARAETARSLGTGDLRKINTNPQPRKNS